MAVDTGVREGAEVRIETGRGHIEKIDEKGRNAQLVIRADGLNLAVQGWIEKTNPCWPVAQAAHTGGQRISYRIVTKRKPDQDQTVPLEQVPKFKRVRDVEDISPIGGAGSAPGADGPPAAAPAAPPPATRSAPAGSDGAQAPAPTAPIAQAHNGGNRPIPNQPPEPPEDNSPPQRDADKPYQHYNPDGTLNLGSYAAQAAMGMVDTADEMFAEAGLPASIAQLEGLAARLLRICDEVQASTRQDGKPDRMASSHARARGAVHTALRRLPFPFVPAGVEGPERDRIISTRDDWEAKVIARAGGILHSIARLDAAGAVRSVNR